SREGESDPLPSPSAERGAITLPHDQRLYVRLRQPFRDGGGAGCASGGTQFTAEAGIRPLYRAIVGHRLHRAAGGEPALVALPDAPVRRAPALSALRRRGAV